MSECNCFYQASVKIGTPKEYLKHDAWCIVNAPKSKKTKELPDLTSIGHVYEDRYYIECNSLLDNLKRLKNNDFTLDMLILFYKELNDKKTK